MDRTPSFKLKIINKNIVDHIRISRSDAERICPRRIIDANLEFMVGDISEIEITPTMWLCIEFPKKEKNDGI